MSEQSADLVVVGCGAGGLATAAQFLQSRPGGSVVVLERTTRERRGGNTAWTGSFFRLGLDGTPTDDFASRMRELSGGLTPEPIIATLTARAKDTIDWLNQCGVATTAEQTYFLTSQGARLMPDGGGATIVEKLSCLIEESGGRIEYQMTARRLLQDGSGAVVAVEAQGPDGSTHLWHAKTVVLACGGFEGNPSMLQTYLGEQGRDLPTITAGGRANRGEGIEMAVAAGAATDGQFDRFHGEPVDPRAHVGEALVMVYPYGIVVDHRGQRFLDEGADTPDNTFESVAYQIWRDADQFAYLIADQKLARQQFARAVLTDRAPEQADTLDELALRFDIDPAQLRATVDAYNAAAQPGELDLHSLDGVATTGLVPAKSNWARPIDEPPYLAWPLTCAITFTFGGVRTDERAQVLRPDGQPIAGLFAVGELAGVYHHRYPGATSVLRALVFGRIAGEHAAATTSGGSAAIATVTAEKGIES